MDAYITLIVLLSNLYIAVRLILFQRKGSKFRFWVSFLAYTLIVCSGAQVIDTLVNHAHTSLWQAGFSLSFAFLVWKAKGNVACIVRIMS